MQRADDGRVHIARSLQLLHRRLGMVCWQARQQAARRLQANNSSGRASVRA